VAGDDPQYLAWCRKQRCCMSAGLCAGVGVEAHHSTHGRGMGQRGPDTRAFPFCMRHHKQFHDATGDFRDMDHARRTAFQAEQVEIYRARYEATFERTSEPAPRTRRAPVAAPLVANDPKTVARQFCDELELGDEVALRLERLLRSYERTVF
jgi:hypothetical protein